MKWRINAVLLPLIFISGCSNLFESKHDHSKSEPIERPFHYEIRLVMENAPFNGRDGAGMLSLNGELCLIGGWGAPYTDTTGMPTGNDVQCTTDSNLQDWTEAKTNNYWFSNSTPYTEDDWEGRHGTAHTVVFQNHYWIVGGDTNSGHYQPDIWTSSNGSDWEKKFDDLPFLHRTGHLTYVRNGCLVVFGGQKGVLDTPEDAGLSYEETIMRDGARTCDGETFTTFNIVADEQFFPAGLTQVGVIGEYAYVVNQGYYPTRVGVRTATTRLYRTRNDVNWEYVTEFPGLAVQFANVLGWDHHLFVMNGGIVPIPEQYPRETNQIFYIDVRTFDNPESIPSQNRGWKQIENVPWSYRHAASVAIHNDKLVIGFGSTLPWGVKNDIWKMVRVYEDEEVSQ